VAVGRSAVTEGGVVRGTLTEDHHGVVPDEVRPVEGVVRRLRVVRQRKRRHDRSWTPVAGAVELRDVRTMPDAFESFDPEARESWTELGALACVPARPLRAPCTSSRRSCSPGTPGS
jgi:hypothetical protein